MEQRLTVKERVEMERVEAAKDPVGRYTRVGLWALPVFALLLGVGTSTHQPPPQTQLADWSRYVTTDIFLIKHLVASIGGAVFGVLGIMAMGGLLLLISSLVIFGVATARRPELPRLAGIGLAVSVVLFALIGFLLDNWVQTVASALMLASSVWIVIALSREPGSVSDARI